MRADSARRLFGWIFLVLASAKLVLIADQEIFGQQFDEIGYARSIIDHYYNCDPNANWLFIRPVGFPLFGAICMETGIPYRVCIEIVFLWCVAFFSRALLPVFKTPWVPLLASGGLMFHPWVLTAFNQLLTEPFYLCLILLFVGLSIRLVLAERWRLWTLGLWGFGLLMALMVLTRRESPWLYGVLALVFAVRFIRLYWVVREGFWRSAWPMALIIIPALVYQGTLLAVSAVNHQKWGIFATNEQEAPGFSSLLNVLYRIDTPDPSIWAPVTRQTLEMAMAVSPRFATLREELENPHTANMYYGEQTTGRQGELGAWMWWQLYTSLSVAKHYTSPKAANDWMLATAAELEGAFADGRLPERSFSTPFPIDPNFGLWLPEFPKLLWATLKRFHNTGSPFNFSQKEAQISAIDRPYFDKAANRRSELMAQEAVEVRGLAFADTGRLDFVTVEDADGMTVAAAAPDGEVNWRRSDIRKLTGVDQIFETAFRMTFYPRTKGPYTLILWKDGQRLLTYPLRDRSYPHRTITPRTWGAPGTDLTVLHYNQPGGTGLLTEAGLRGWAFSGNGVLSHVVFVAPDGAELRRARVGFDRPDLAKLYEDAMGHPPEGPLGFSADMTLSEAVPITVQFWKDDLLIHELPMEGLTKGYWERIADTLSGISLTLGIGYQELPKASAQAGWRETVRDFLMRHYFVLLMGGSLFLAVWFGLWYYLKEVVNPISSPDLWLILLLMVLILLGRAVFYGLVEAAVVPGVSRYIDCVAPIAAVFLALFMIGLMVGAGRNFRKAVARPISLH
jgi:hypothetical protein